LTDRPLEGVSREPICAVMHLPALHAPPSKMVLEVPQIVSNGLRHAHSVDASGPAVLTLEPVSKKPVTSA
jgi:hypothetical protein